MDLPRTTPDDFGGGIAQGLSAVAKGVKSFADLLEVGRKQQQVVDFDKGKSEYKLGMDEFDRTLPEEDNTALWEPQRVRHEERLRAQIMKRTPDPETRRLLEREFQELSTLGIIAVRHDAAQMANQQRRGYADQALIELSQQAAEAQDPAQRQELMDRYRGIIMGLSTGAEPAINPVDAQARLQTFNNSVRTKRQNYFAEELQAELDKIANDTRSNPARADANFKAGVGKIEAAAAGSDVAPELVSKYKRILQQSNYLAKGRGEIEANPLAADKELKAGKYNGLLSPEHLNVLKTEARAEIARLEALAKAARVEREKWIGTQVKDRAKALDYGQPWAGNEAALAEAVVGSEHERDFIIDSRNFDALYGFGRRAPFARTPEPGAPGSKTNWVPGDISKVQKFFSEAFEKELPISARGQSDTHTSMGFDHRNGVDVAVNPTTKEGVALMNYLDSEGIPFIGFDRAVPGQATGPHIHIGPRSPRLMASQRDEILALRRNADGTPRAMTGDEAELVKKLEASHDRTVTALKKDPLAYMEDIGMVPNLGPIDLGNPDSMRAREQATALGESHFRVTVPPMTDADATLVKESYEKAGVVDKAKIITALAAGYSQDSHVKVGKMLAGKNSSLAMNFELATRPGIDRSVLLQVLQGEEITKVERNTVFPEKDSIKLIEERINRNISAAYVGAPVYYDAIKKATIDYLAAELWKSGAVAKGGTASDKQIDNAVNAITGGVINVRGTPTVAPQVGIDETDFLDMLRWADYRNLMKGFKAEDIINRGDAKFYYYQEGRYKVRIGNVVVQDAKGNDFVLDLNDRALVNQPLDFSRKPGTGMRPDVRAVALEAQRRAALAGTLSK